VSDDAAESPEPPQLIQLFIFGRFALGMGDAINWPYADRWKQVERVSAALFV
jgi:hypothetical protein